jgi:hypothetical protein
MGRKDNLARNIARCRSKHSSKIYNFLPESYVLPQASPLPIDTCLRQSLASLEACVMCMCVGVGVGVCVCWVCWVCGCMCEMSLLVGRGLAGAEGARLGD